MPEELSPEAAEAVHKAKNAAQAIELAREAQIAKTVEDTAQRTKEALLEGLKEVFGGSEGKDPQDMKVLVHRIPILCVRIDNMDANITSLIDNQKWVTRMIIGGVIAAVLALVLK